MGNYSPVSNPAANWPGTATYTVTADGPLTGGDPAQFSPNGQVHRAEDGTRYAGIAAKDAATGASVQLVAGEALQKGAVEGAVSAGDDLTVSAVPGRQVRAAQPGEPVIGEAYQAATDGGQVVWKQTK